MGPVMLSYHYLIDLLSHNMKQAGAATNAKGLLLMRLPLLLTSSICLTAPAMAEVPRIVTDIPATASLVQSVIGDLGQVDLLLPKGSDAHHHQLRPSDARGLQNADLLVWIGPAMTPWLDHAGTALGAHAHQLRLIEVPGTHLQPFGTGHDHDHAHGDDAPHDHDHENHGAAHVHSGTDPHAWLDPQNAQLWLGAIAEELAELDPDNAEIYRQNSATAGRQIADLDARIAADLAPISNRDFIVFHDAYGYFTGHYGLRPAISVSLGDASTPSAGRLKEIKDRITATGASCAFAEFGHDAKLIESVIEGTEVTRGNDLDPTGSSLTIGAQLYGQLLDGMADSLRGCLNNS
jgi:zinc transport system substrate-binding protein